jgi:dolichyl-phosphate-mannose--protein O-mannosyl transferase
MEIGENSFLQPAMAIIRYGSEIILRHEPTGGFLRSPGVPYRHPKSSQQDQVTCPTAIDSKSYWIVMPPHGYPDDYLYGQPIPDGAVLRLENRASRKHLHSHGNAPLPVSN